MPSFASRWLRLAAMALGILLLVSGVLLVVVLATDFGIFRSPIARAASEAIGREIRVDGALSLRIGRDVRIHATEVWLADAPWAGGAAMLEIGRLEAVVDARSVLSGPIRVRSLAIADVRAHVRRNGAGRRNWDLGNGDDTGRERRDVALPQVDAVTAQRVGIVIDDPALRRPATIELATAQLRRQDDQFRVAMRGAVDGRPMNLDAVLASHGPTGAVDELTIDVDARLGEIAVTAAARVDRLPQPARPSVELRLSGADVRHLLDVLGLRATASGAFDVRATLARDATGVTLASSGTVGELRFGVRGSAPDLARLADATLEVEASGPDLGRVGQAFGAARLPGDPFEVAATLTRIGGATTIATSGRVGALRFSSRGRARSLANLEGLELDFEAAGPDLGRAAQAIGFTRLRHEPFELGGRVASTPAGLSFEKVELRVAGSTFLINGMLMGLRPFDAEDLVLTVRGTDIARFRSILGELGLLSGPFTFTARVLPDASGYARVRVVGTVAETSVDLTLHLSDAPGYAGSFVEFDLQGPDVRLAARGAGFDRVPALPFRATGKVIHGPRRARLEGIALTVGGLQFRAAGTVDAAAPARSAALAVELDAARLGPALEPFGVAGGPDVAARLSTAVAVDPSRIRLADLVLTIGDVVVSGALARSRGAAVPTTDFELASAGGSLRGLVPRDFAWQPGAGAFQARVKGTHRGGVLAIDDGQVAIGAARVEFSGAAARHPEPEALGLDVGVDVPSLAALGTLRGAALPDVSLAIDGRVVGSTESIAGDGLRMSLGDSTLELDVRYTRGPVPRVDLALHSPRLDLTSFGRSQDAAPSPTPTAAARIIPAIHVPVEFLGRMNGEVSVTIDELLTPAAQPRDVRLRARLQSGVLQVEELGALGRRARATSSFQYGPGGEGYVLTGQLAAEGVTLGPRSEPIETMLAQPAAGVRAEFTARGSDLRTLLATMNGSLVLDGDGGRVAKSGWLAGIYAGDLLTEALRAVNPFWTRDDQAYVQCHAAVLRIREGVLEGDPLMVYRTREMDIAVGGTVNLATETLDLAFRSTPRRGLGISLGQTINPYAKISGTLAAPRLGVNQQAVLLEGGAAVATGGLTILLKALRDRFVSVATDPCRSLLESDARESWAGRPAGR